LFIFSVSQEGKVVVAGFTSLQLPELNINELLRRPSFSLIGVSLNNYRTHSIKIYRYILSYSKINITFNSVLLVAIHI